MLAPHLLAKERRGLALALAILALANAAIAFGFAMVINDMITTRMDPPLSVIVEAFSLVAAAGLVVLSERWIAERFAQSYVLSCRQSIFEGVIRNRGTGSESRWITALVGDLAALRNYAVRGSVRLWTSFLAGSAASLMFFLTAPLQRTALIPFVCGLVAMLLCARFLSRIIAKQRMHRGKLNSFLLRRVRKEVNAAEIVRGHGRRNLLDHSQTLSRIIESRASLVGLMEACAIAAGGIAVVVLIYSHHGATATESMVGQLSLIGFVATCMLEFARALHAQRGGVAALRKLEALLQRQPGPADDRNPKKTVSTNDDDE